MNQSEGIIICNKLWKDRLPSSVEAINDWVITGFRTEVPDISDPEPRTTPTDSFRTNGLFSGADSASNYQKLTKFGINAGPFGVDGDRSFNSLETSDFELADYIVFNHALSDAQMRQVEKRLAFRYGISLTGAAPQAPMANTALVDDNSLSLTWSAPAQMGDGLLYKYQVRVRDAAQMNSWSYANSTYVENFTWDFVQQSNLVLQRGTTYEMQVRAVTDTGVSPWSETKSITYATESVPNTDASNPVVARPPTPTVPNVVSQPAPITQVDSRTAQSVKRFATKVKRGKRITLPLKTFQGSNITYTTSKGCKLNKKFKTVTVKVGKKKKKRVKVQTSWQLRGMKKKAVCQVTVAAFETSSHLAFLEKRSVRVR